MGGINKIDHGFLPKRETSAQAEQSKEAGKNIGNLLNGKADTGKSIKDTGLSRKAAEAFKNMSKEEIAELAKKIEAGEQSDNISKSETKKALQKAENEAKFEQEKAEIKQEFKDKS